MTPEQFVEFIESIYDADDISGRAGPSKTYIRAIFIGYEYPNLRPPKSDDPRTRRIRDRS
jgi:hypothetical protein